MKDITEPLPDPITGKPSFVRAMAEEFFNREPFESLEQWEWEWLRQDLTVAQIEEGLTAAFEYGPNPSHSLVFNILEAARSRVEHGLPPYGKLWEGPSGTDKERYIAQLAYLQAKAACLAEAAVRTLTSRRKMRSTIRL